MSDPSKSTSLKSVTCTIVLNLLPVYHMKKVHIILHSSKIFQYSVKTQSMTWFLLCLYFKEPMTDDCQKFLLLAANNMLI